MTLRDGVNRKLDVRLASSAASASRAYNPGGVVPEVAQPAPWIFFAAALATLAALLLLPGLVRGGLGAVQGVRLGGGKRMASSGKVRLNDDSRSSQGRVRLH
jgi:hypothetical protein